MRWRNVPKGNLPDSVTYPSGNFFCEWEDKIIDCYGYCEDSIRFLPRNASITSPAPGTLVSKYNNANFFLCVMSTVDSTKWSPRADCFKRMNGIKTPIAALTGTWVRISVPKSCICKYINLYGHRAAIDGKVSAIFSGKTEVVTTIDDDA